MYDVIGDIHGHADALRRLLLRLGYVEGADGFRHPGRTAVFLGDFIDRGPAIRQVLATVRPMVASGAALAVMGNHEFNAISFHTAHPTVVPGWLRERSLRHIRQYLETIRQIPTDAELEDHIAWFTTLPLRLELDGLRIVHACWDEPAFAVIDAAARDTGGVNAVFFARATETDDALFDAVESVLKGPEAALPPDTAFLDSDGQRRRHARVRWYLADAARRLVRHREERDAATECRPQRNHTHDSVLRCAHVAKSPGRARAVNRSRAGSLHKCATMVALSRDRCREELE